MKDENPSQSRGCRNSNTIDLSFSPMPTITNNQTLYCFYIRKLQLVKSPIQPTSSRHCPLKTIKRGQPTILFPLDTQKPSITQITIIPLHQYPLIPGQPNKQKKGSTRHNSSAHNTYQTSYVYPSISGTIQKGPKVLKSSIFLQSSLMTY